MASSKEYLIYILDLLREVDGISHKNMMGEFLLYKDGVLFGGVYDDRFLVKKTPSLACLAMREELPYDGAKPMLVVETDDAEEVKDVVLKVCFDLNNKK
ncbi:MAG: TfoX/Sxy family protein [Clostridia bacterium]|nr:TfoX/Sxy family protein [Clostridia bacterium]